MASLPNAFTSVTNSRMLPLSGSHLKPMDNFLANLTYNRLSLAHICQKKVKISTSRRFLTVQAAFSEDGGQSSSAIIFIGGFVLGGLVVGTLGCIYAPQISKALDGADRKDLMRKLPKFIYDEEKALEKTRKILTEKIAQLNSAIDDVSAQLRAQDTANGSAVSEDSIEATT